METKQNNGYEYDFKSHILLPVFFIITLAVAICLVVIDDFAIDFNPFIIWFYFGLLLAYVGVAVLDIFLNQRKTKNRKIFIGIMAILCVMSDIFYIIAYLLNK